MQVRYAAGEKGLGNSEDARWRVGGRGFKGGSRGFTQWKADVGKLCGLRDGEVTWLQGIEERLLVVNSLRLTLVFDVSTRNLYVDLGKGDWLRA